MIKNYREYIYQIVVVIIAAAIQSYSIEVFMKPSNLIAGGFTGSAMLINTIANAFGYNVSISILLVLLNLPVALLCAKEISKKFVFLSLLHIFCSSFFLSKFDFQPIFSNVFLNITIGSVVYAAQIAMALRVGGSTGGTDFIALYISNKINKSIWIQVFLFNVMIVGIFGYLFGWDGAGYSIVFQFINTKVIDTFYNRYHRMTVQIFTKKSQDICKRYIQNHRHGMTKMLGKGVYSGDDIDVCFAVVSVYEVTDLVKMIQEIDPDAIINIFKTEDFYGKFYFKPI